jgi:hypothetical protein
MKQHQLKRVTRQMMLNFKNKKRKCSPTLQLSMTYPAAQAHLSSSIHKPTHSLMSQHWGTLHSTLIGTQTASPIRPTRSAAANWRQATSSGCYDQQQVLDSQAGTVQTPATVGFDCIQSCVIQNTNATIVGSFFWRTVFIRVFAVLILMGKLLADRIAYVTSR